jgi:hypothetical protein
MKYLFTIPKDIDAAMVWCMVWAGVACALTVAIMLLMVFALVAITILAIFCGAA